MDEDNFIGKIFDSWKVLEKINEIIYRCQCNKCNFIHMVSKENIILNISCQTCPQSNVSPIFNIIDMVGGILGIDAQKKKDINLAFDKLKQPEFKEAYSSLERASNAIKNVMNNQQNNTDVAKKILEVELSHLKNSFNNLIRDGKITQKEADSIKSQINTEQNMRKLKSILEIAKREKKI
jgi:hypothetical protein